jgi:anti-sigma B factor antagonist
MDIHEIAQGAVIVLKPVGQLTAADAGAFKAKAADAARRSLGRILVDASAIAFVDSRGIEALADVTEELAEGGRALKLCGANTTIRKVLELTGWSDSFEFYDDVNAGTRSFL